MAIFIEFFGLPGSGKSTIARELTAALGDGYASSSDVLWDDRGKWTRRLKKMALYVFGRFSGEYRSLIWKALAVKQSSFRNKLAAVTPLTTFFSLRSKFNAKGQNAIYDQGLLQAIFSISYGAVDKKKMDEAISELTKFAVNSDQFHVIVDTHSDICRSRLRDRVANHSRFDPNDDASWERGVYFYNKIKDQMVTGLEPQDSSRRTLVLDGTQPVERSLQLIIDWMESSLQPDQT